MQYPKTLFVHGRPEPHPFHVALARSVEADFLPVDFLLRWHDRSTSRYRRYLSWLLCGVCLPRHGYQIILSEGPYMPPLVAKSLRLLRGHQKTVALLSGETLSFMKSGYYTVRTSAKLAKLLGRYDALICSGPLVTKLAHELVPVGPMIRTIPTGFSRQRAQALERVSPQLEGDRLLYVANGPNGARAWYKGIEFVLETFELVAANRPDIELVIVGEWDLDYRQSLLAKFPNLAGRITFTGIIRDISVYVSYVASSCLCIHLTRGDACPISVLEVMAGGLPVIISDFTGTYDAVAQVDPSLIVPLDSRVAAERIVTYLRSSLDEKRRLSAVARKVALTRFTEERSISEFRSALLAISPSLETN